MASHRSSFLLFGFPFSDVLPLNRSAREGDVDYDTHAPLFSKETAWLAAEETGPGRRYEAVLRCVEILSVGGDCSRCVDIGVVGTNLVARM